MPLEGYLNKFSSGATKVLALGLLVQLSGFLFNNDGSRYATQVHLLLFLPALLLLLSTRVNWQFWRQPSAYLLLALLGWVALRGSLGGDSAHPGGYWLKISLFIMLYIFAIYHLMRNDLLQHPILAAIALSAVFAWLTLYYQFSILDKPLSYEALRTDGRLSALGWKGFADLIHPIIAGLYYGFFSLLLLCLFVEFELRKPQRVLIMAGLAGLLFYLLLTFSRGAWFSTLAAGLTLLVLTPKDRGRKLLALGTLIIACMIMYFWHQVQNEWRLGTSARGPIWLNWWERLPEFWMWGDGAGNKLVYRYPWGDMAYHAHSLYLQLWYEFGVIGISLFLALLATLALKAWSLRDLVEARIGLAALVFAMVAMVSDVYAIFHRPSVYWVILWLPIGFIIALERPPQKTTESTVQNDDTGNT